MKNKKIFALLLVAVMVVCLSALGVVAYAAAAEPGSKGEIDVWLIGGQSNAVGYAAELPEDASSDPRYTDGFDNVIFYGATEGTENPTGFAPLTAEMVNKAIPRSGAEVGIASALGDGDRMNAIIKCAWGSTKLYPLASNQDGNKYKTWTSPSYVNAKNSDADTENDIDTATYTNIGAMYSWFLDTVKDGLSLLIAEGYTPEIKGMWYMQGEAETAQAAYASEYEALLTCLINDMRNDLMALESELNAPTLFGENSMPFVMGKIIKNESFASETDLANIATVNAAQSAVCDKLPLVKLVDVSDKYGFGQYDSWHYMIETQMHLGEQFVASVKSYENKYLVTSDGAHVSLDNLFCSEGESVTARFTVENGYYIHSASLGGEAVTVADDGTYTFTMPAGEARFCVSALPVGAEAEVTPYGTIPKEYNSPDDYPIVVFDKDGNFVGTARYYNADAIPMAVAAGDGAAILFRADFDMSVEDTATTMLSHTAGSFTIDLGGHTVRMGDASVSYKTAGTFDGMIKLDAHLLDATTSVTMKNGTVLMGGDPVVRFSAALSETRTSAAYQEAVIADSTRAHKFNVTLDGVDFGVDTRVAASDFYNKPLVYSYRNSSEITTSAISDSTLTVRDCNFDLRELTVAVYLVIDGNIRFDTQFLGGSIIADGMDYVTPVKNTSGSTTVFGAGSDGKYTSLRLPHGKAAPATAFSGADGVSKSFAAAAYKSGEITYILDDEGKDTKSSDIDTYPFAVFYDSSESGSGEPVWTYADSYEYYSNGAYSTKSTTYQNAAIYSAVTYGESGKRALILMRRDFTSTTKEYNQMDFTVALITIDLGGYTFTAWSGQYDSIIHAVKKTTTDCDYILQNGTVVLNKMAVVKYNAVAGSGGSFNVTLRNLTIKPSSESSTIITGRRSALVQSYNLNVDVEDCLIDLSESTAQNYVFSAKDTTSTGEFAVIDIDVIGSKIKADSLSGVTLVTEGTNGSSVNFERLDGKYLSVEIAKDTTAPGGTYKSENGSIVFKKTVGTETTDIYELVIEAAANLDFTPKASVTLDSNLIFNIYLPAHAGLGEVTLNGAKVTLGEAKDGYYLITKELPVYEAAKTLTLVVNLSVNGSDIKGTFTFSTVKYAAKLLEMNTSDKEAALAKDMLSYIRSAYNYFTEQVSEADKTAVTAAINEILGDYNPETIDRVSAPESKDDGDILSGATLVLEATPEFRFVLHAGAAAEGYTFKIGNKALEYTTGSFEDNGDTYYYYDISLYAYEMLSEITIEKDGKTANYHINTYYDGAVNTDENDIVTKFYNYCTSAKAYRQYVLENQ